jgi:hypothetical protein
MKISKYVIVCWILGIIFILFGTATEKYTFEIFAIFFFVISYILADWDHLFSNEKEKQKEKT